jgi:hypothetical protein
MLSVIPSDIVLSVVMLSVALCDVVLSVIPSNDVLSVALCDVLQCS